MRTAETVLNVIRARGSRKLHLEDVYRQLFNPELYLTAYARIYKNDGAMTKGANEETVDGMSQRKITETIEALRFERWKWTPVRRVEIPKKNGKLRPLGLPTWSDKMVQEVMRSILEAYYEPQFSDHSHGFRPDRGCHTALNTIEKTWKGAKWFIEGDIKGCFDNIDHSILVETLREKIHDNRFLRLIEGLLKSGYMENWKYRHTLSGTPQGGIISPILANIYLDKLDKFVEETLLPKYNRGQKRRSNTDYGRLSFERQKMIKMGDMKEASALLKQMFDLPSLDPNDSNYRRLRYVRYADDFLLGFVGPKEEAEEIKSQIRNFLAEAMKLELSEEKTLITHASDSMASFLGHHIVAQRNNTRIGPTGQRSTNGKIALRVPSTFVEERCQRYMRNGRVMHRSELMGNSDYDIVTRYQQEYRGFVNFYARAINIHWLNKVNGVMRESLLKTLASKHKCSVNQIWQKYNGKVETPHGPRACLRVVVPRGDKGPLVTYFGGLPLKRNPHAVIREPKPMTILGRTEIVSRLLADECEVCGSKQDVEVHHVRKLSDLKVKGQREKPLWMQMMIARRRKTLVLCRKCHVDLHAGRPLKNQHQSE